MTQEELGKLVDVKKPPRFLNLKPVLTVLQFNLLRVFKALKTELNFNLKLGDNFLKLTNDNMGVTICTI